VADYYVDHAGKRSGPYGEHQFNEMLVAEEFQPLDLYWTEGMVEWEPIKDLIQYQRPPTVPPPVQEGRAPSPLTMAPLMLAAIIGGTGFQIARNLAKLNDNREILIAPAALVLIPLVLVVTVTACIYLYSCWSALPKSMRFTSPGKAVGFMFIPIFNIYWIFMITVKLAEHLQEWQIRRNLIPVRNLVPLAYVKATLAVISILSVRSPKLLLIIEPFSMIASISFLALCYKAFEAVLQPKAHC
jgi:hypothetical protein